jgi:RNA polymerase sigma-70 factor (ECF subfamily)
MKADGSFGKAAKVEMELTLPVATRRDDNQFERWFDAYAPLVLRTARRLTGSTWEADEIAQEVFLKLHRHRERWVDQDPKSWIYRVTVNACHDRRKALFLAEPLPESLPAEWQDPVELVEAERQKKILELGLKYLSDRERQAIVLRDIEGLLTSEVASILDVEEVTVRSLVAQGRLKLKRFAERLNRPPTRSGDSDADAKKRGKEAR